MQKQAGGSETNESRPKVGIPEKLMGVPGTNLERALETDFSKFIGILKGKFEIKGDIYSTGFKD